MTKVKFFSVCTMCIFLVCTTLVFALDKPTKFVRNDELVRQYDNPSRSLGPNRDVDDFFTFRYIMSSDGGESWSEPMGAGDTGMIDGEGDDAAPAWNSAGYTFGAVVDNDNNLHFIVALTAFNPDNNPSERVNGVYDVMPDGEGGGTYTLIAAQPEDGSFVWADAGRDADGTLYVIWVNTMDSEENSHSELWASKSSDEGWTDPFMIANDLDTFDHYPHMTYDVGEYYYVIYEKANGETEMFDHFIAEVPASHEGEATITNAGVSSLIYYSYYIGSVSAIAQDVAEGSVYFAVRNEDLTATAVGNYNGEEWTIESIDGAQRYPSVMMQGNGEDFGTPWVFSNVGPPGEEQEFMHHNWYSFDEGGYNGGDWNGQNKIQSILYEGGKFLLYCHTGVVTENGRIVSGTNVWGAFTPDQFQAVYSDDNGESWSDPQTLWSIYGDGDTFIGGFIPQNHMVAGNGETVYVAFAGQYGESDFDGPVCMTTDVSDVNLGDPANVVTATFNDATGVEYESGYVWLNWMKSAEGYAWEAANADSMDIDDNGNGTYWFTLPDSVVFWVNDSTAETRTLVDGDMVNFYVDAYDVFLTYGAEHDGAYTNIWTVGDGWTGVEADNRPMPNRIELGQNYPNPFNNETVIPYSVNISMDVKLSIFDINGRLIENLVNGRVAAGNHTVAWQGVGASTGVYFYIMEAAGQRHVSKLTLLR